MKTLLIVIFFTLFWLTWAIVLEKKDRDHSYKASDVRENDSIMTSLRKIRYCMTYELRVIKWRRSLISAVIATFLIFLLCWRRFPTSQEFITHMLLFTAIFAAMWNNFVVKTGSDVLNYCDKNIENIKKLLKENHSFILPSAW